MLAGQQLGTTLATLPIKPEQSTTYRLVPLRFQNTLLSAVGSFLKGGRYNIAQTFEVLYTSGSPITALKELNFLVKTSSGIVAFPGEPLILLSLSYSLQSILDLTDPNHQNILGTNLQELTGDFLRLNAQGQIAPTQELGAVAYNLQTIQALKVPSASDLDPDSYNLVIFPDRLAPNSFIQVYDPSGTIQARLP